MTGGYTGKILRVNLSTKTIGTIDTAKYEEFGGGHGIGSAVFFDLVGDQLPFEAFDPRNLIIMMASPFSGTFMPGSGRCEVQGLGPMLYPVEWFGHSNFGGRFTAQLKFAGWDGIVVEGASSEPVWINIVNDKVKIESAKGIWGMDTWDTQEEISRRVIPTLKYGEWAELAEDCHSTQIPAVVCCGPAGENKSRERSGRSASLTPCVLMCRIGARSSLSLRNAIFEFAGPRCSSVRPEQSLATDSTSSRV